MDEFSLIERYFNRPVSSKLVCLGIGDDAAALKLPADRLLVQTMDSLHAGIHFPHETGVADIARKSLAVNVSDLAAMAAQPAFFLLSLTLPDANETFLDEFSRALFEAADFYGIELIGGDTCRGPLSVTIQASGLVQPDQLLRRDTAQVGDHLFVSGQLGLAALGLALVQGKEHVQDSLRDTAIDALNRPLARVDLIPLLHRFASAAIDISDGLVGDLGHLARRSGVGACIYRDALPVAEWIRTNQRYELALSGGDDYQLLFSVPASRVDELLVAIEQQQIDCTPIGRVTRSGLLLQQNASSSTSIDLTQSRGFMHFGQ
jgi:thiamine-monophosphate kinase